VGLAIGTKSEQGSRTGRCGWITSFLGSTLAATLGGGECAWQTTLLMVV
jgi:hypothetical protein